MKTVQYEIKISTSIGFERNAPNFSLPAYCMVLSGTARVDYYRIQNHYESKCPLAEEGYLLRLCIRRFLTSNDMAPILYPSGGTLRGRAGTCLSPQNLLHAVENTFHQHSQLQSHGGLQSGKQRLRRHYSRSRLRRSDRSTQSESKGLPNHCPRRARQNGRAHLVRPPAR